MKKSERQNMGKKIKETFISEKEITKFLVNPITLMPVEHKTLIEVWLMANKELKLDKIIEIIKDEKRYGYLVRYTRKEVINERKTAKQMDTSSHSNQTGQSI